MPPPPGIFATSPDLPDAPTASSDSRMRACWALLKPCERRVRLLPFPGATATRSASHTVAAGALAVTDRVMGQD